MDRHAKWQRLIDLVCEADALQQELVKDSDQCYYYHNQLDNMADDFENLAEEEVGQ